MFVQLSVLLLCLCGTIFANTTTVTTPSPSLRYRCINRDYYWRPYDGSIPYDAILGGTDASGKAFFIGQAFFPDYGLLTAQIQVSEEIAVTTADNKVLFNNNKNFIKILCSQHSDRFRWIQTTTNEARSNTKLIQAGINARPIRLLYVGRAYYKGSLRLGKVSFERGAEGMAVPDGTHVIRLQSFEVLMFEHCPGTGPIPPVVPVAPVLEVPPSNYYWKDYTGTIPPDAAIGGRDPYPGGNYIYIGQVHIDGYGTLPATIHQNQKIAVVHAGDSIYRLNRFVKIFCSNTPGQIRWVRTTSSELAFIPNKIIGGYENGLTLSIGKVNRFGYDFIGRIYEDKTPKRGLWYVFDKDSVVNTLSYDVLVFDESNGGGYVSKISNTTDDEVLESVKSTTIT